MKLTNEEKDVIRDLRAMEPEMATAWMKTGGMLAGRLPATAESKTQKSKENQGDISLALITEPKLLNSYLPQLL